MKKLISIAVCTIALFTLSTITANAYDATQIYDTSGLYDSLSDEVKQSLSDMGVEEIDSDSLQNLSFSDVIEEITKLATQNASSPLKGLISVTALLLICSILSCYKTALSGDISNAMNITATLCITCAVAFPAVEVIQNTASIIKTASNIMLAYIPIMVVIMAASGHAVSGASYYSMMIAAGQGVSQLSSKVIVPLLNMFLAVSITGSITPEVNLKGFTEVISKTVKWILGFAMTVFTAILSFKQLITTSVDDVSTRAVRFTLNSFIPIVGSALSDAYKTVQGSVNLLKSGIGVFVILSVSVAFLPVILQTLMWIITLSAGKACAEVMSLSQVKNLLESVCTVFSTLLAIILCIMSVYIISTALVLMMGGGGS